MPRKDLLAAAAESIARKIAHVATDPRKLKPGELCRLLNSTPAGSVLNDRQLRSHRTRAGLRIGDGKTVDLFRYAAWLRRELVSADTAGGDGAGSRVKSGDDGRDAYEAKKERERERNAENSRTGRDIGELPAVADPKRRAAACKSFRKFCETYFGERFVLEWSLDHLRMIERLQETVDVGGLQAFAMPRGSGKTTLCEVAVLWAALTGRRKFIALIGASKAHADEMLDSIKGELETNDLLAEDFPEVCVPIRALEGIHNRCKGQLHKGKRTLIRWAGNLIVLPTIEGSQASSVIICVRGITGRVRGMKFRRPDGETVRPDCCLIDDPQTDQSAASPVQCTKRLRIVTGAILGLAGPGKKIAAMMPCTVICRGDMADQVLDREKHPEWHGELTKLLYEWPKAIDLWDKYADLRRDSFRDGGSGEAANSYYQKNRKAMDAGAKPAWPARKNPDELSALQHCMNLWIDSPETFESEYQNSPKAQDHEADQILAPGVLQTKVNGLARGVVPLACTNLTAFVDVQHSVLYWVVVAWWGAFDGAVVDYGTFPDQQRAHFTVRQVRRTLQQLSKGTSLQAAVLAGLEALTDQLLDQEWKREDGDVQKIELCLIDAQDGQLTETINTFCRTSRHAALVTPSNGKGIGPGDRPMSEWAKKPGERLGDHWLQKRSTKHAVRHVLIDTNFWKTFIHQRLAAAPGDKGSLSLFGRKGTDHRMLDEHATSEYRQQLVHEKSGRKVDVWKLKPGQSENHWFDGLVGNAVAASMRGLSLIAARKTPKPTAARQPRRAAYL